MSGGPLVFIHSSDELYGADRMLLMIHAALPLHLRQRSQFWLPSDLAHGSSPLCAELERRGATVHHVDLPVLRRAYRTPLSLALLALRSVRLIRHLRRVAPDLVYCTTSATFLAGPLARLARVPRVIGHVQEFWTPNDERVLGRLARSFDQMVAISTPVSAALPGAIQARTCVVLNATAEPDSHAPLAGRMDPLHYVVASRWNAWKGHRTLLAAWDLLDEPGILTVLGGAPSSGESVEVRELTRSMRHRDSVYVVGEVPDAHRYVEDADVLVIPSDKPEPFGLVAVEAFARGRPVVGSNAGGLADIVTHGVDGWLYEPGNARALARVLAGLTRDQVTRAGAEARITYQKRFTPERYATDWLAALDLD